MNPGVKFNWKNIFENHRIYLYDLNKISKQIAEDLIINKKYKSYNHISTSLKINSRGFYYSIFNHRPINIDSFIKLVSLNNFPIEKYLRKNKIKSILLGGGSRKNLVNFPLVINSETAYLVGYLFGDGCLKTNKWTINFCDEYFEQMELINNLFFKLFNIKGDITRTEVNRYELNIYSKVLFIFFNKVFDMPIGKKEIIRMPKIIDGSQLLKISFLRGFSDADAGLPRIEEYPIIPSWIRRSSNIEISSKYKYILEDLREILKQFDTASNLYFHKTNDSFRLIISGRINITKCKDFKMFMHPIKKERLNSLVKILSPR